MLTKRDMRIIFGAGFLVALRDIVGSWFININVLGILSIFMIVLFVLTFYRWFDASLLDQKIVPLHDFGIPLLIMMMGFSLHNRLNFFSLLLVVGTYHSLRSWLSWQQKGKERFLPFIIDSIGVVSITLLIVLSIVKMRYAFVYCIFVSVVLMVEGYALWKEKKSRV